MLGHLQLAEEGVGAALKYGGAGLEGERLDLVLEVGGLLLQLADLTLLVPDLWETRVSVLHIMYTDQAPHPNPIFKFPVFPVYWKFTCANFRFKKKFTCETDLDKF